MGRREEGKKKETEKTGKMKSILTNDKQDNV